MNRVISFFSPLVQRIRKLVAGRDSRSERAFRRPAVMAIECLEQRQLLAAAYFSPAEDAGSVNVRLVPLANVKSGVQEVVTFGIPFARGSVTEADLAQVRVLKNGVEIPAFVEQLTPWRSIDDPTVDEQFVRVARIQIGYTFATLSPGTITVEWGGAARTLHRPTLQDPRLEWHTVTSGTFVATNKVEEPDVLPVLPREYLAQGMLDTRTNPTASSVAETRDDPALMDSMNFSGYTEYDYAQKNFFYTIINQNPGISINYKTDAEPWLYDRASAMYGLYLRSGSATALRQAIRNTDFYADRLDANGFFTLKPGDAKYAYNESLAYSYWLLGDNRMLAPISAVVNAHTATKSRWTPSTGFWTERHVAAKLQATAIAYEVTGSSAYETSLQTIVNDLVWHQNGAGGQLPGNRIDGGLYHTGAQHDITEASSGSVLISSPWMSALVVDSMVRAYGVWQNPEIAGFVVRMGKFAEAASKTDSNGQFGGTTRYPDYLMRANGASDARSSMDVQHAMDVGAVAAWATYFAEQLGTPDPSLRQLANDLYATYDAGVNYWTRPGGTNFNVTPPRRYAWEYKNSGSFSWALTGVDAAPQGFQLVSVTADGQTTLTATYQITGAPAAPFSLGVFRSDDEAFGGDVTLGSVLISDAIDLSVGTHTKSWTIGDGAGQIPLPGAGATETDTDYFLLFVADSDGLVSATDVAALSGVYQTPGGQVLVHGSAGADSVSFSSSSGAIALTLNGTTHSYSSGSVSSFRIRTHAGSDVVGGAAITRPLLAHGGAGADVLTGGSASDKLFGGADNDTLAGNGGNDLLVGGGDDDQLEGGSGNDAYQFDADAPLGSDAVLETLGGGTDLLDFSPTTDRSIAVNLSSTTPQVVASGSLTLTLGQGGVVENVTGGSRGDSLTGNGLANILTGGPGDDTLSGGGGDDKYSFDVDAALGSDTLVEAIGGGVDILDLSASTSRGITLDLALTSQVVSAGILALTFSSSDVFEVVIGGSQNDVLSGNALDNVLIGGPGNDSLLGGGGRDLLVGGTGSDSLSGGDHDDILISGNFAYFNEANRTLNRSAIDALLAEWKRTDSSYAVRVDRLQNGGGLNGSYLLNSATVLTDGTAIDSLFGQAGLDWFWKFGSDVVGDLGAGEIA